jgi:hypothetical protein
MLIKPLHKLLVVLVVEFLVEDYVLIDTKAYEVHKIYNKK